MDAEHPAALSASNDRNGLGLFVDDFETYDFPNMELFERDISTRDKNKVTRDLIK